MKLRIEALYTSDEEGRLLQVNEPNGQPAPRFHLGRTSVGYVCRFRADLDAGLVETLTEICRSETVGDVLPQAPSNQERYLSLLIASSPVEHQSAGPAYRFPLELPKIDAGIRVTAENAKVLEKHFEEWIEDPPTCQPMIGLVVDGHVVSLCASVRITPGVHEAGVETHPMFRGKGYAPLAVAAWAAAVRIEGANPVYSTSWENTASQAVARKLDQIRFGLDFNVT